MSQSKMMSPSERDYQTRRRQLRAQKRALQRIVLAFELFQADRQSDADDYLSRADRVLAVSHARAKGEL